MKKVLKVLLVLFFSVGLASASNLKQNDIDFAFSGVKSSEIVLLNKTDMTKIKGAGWFKHFRHSLRHFGHSIRHWSHSIYKKIRRIPRWRRYRLALQAIGVIGAIYTGGAIYPTFQGFAYSIAW
ncbi:hypothetical protein [Caminibacter pacificus]|uniref:Uncharacterized protein n=1 Tax=Caminibacter pacificus TaxID=1424653 RepID=A0AAJ4UXQ6_9BACT|nr:hypothetical protein [Caminibacter pacificus]QCI28971.1 hypothetical protein C6V80_08300 [Caminibacter pacificus]ROR39561.1 hypothetical protein EDC58_1503 [Caminibacter pacificus]